MTIPRRIAELFVGGVAIGALIAGCGGNAPGGADQAAQALEVPGFRHLQSGELEAILSIEGSGRTNNLYARILGTFFKADRDALPQVDFGAEAKGALRGRPLDLYTALIATDDRAVLTYDGDTFETDRDTFEMLQASFGKSLGSGDSADPAACLEAAVQSLPGLVAGRPAKPTHTTDLEGTAPTVITANLKIQALADAFQRLQAHPGCGPQLEAAPVDTVLEVVERVIEPGAKSAEAKLSMGDDGIVREVSVQVAHAPSHEEGGGNLELRLRLGSVNEVTELPPCYGERPLAALFNELGFNPLRLIESGKADGVVGLLDGIYGQSPNTNRV